MLPYRDNLFIMPPSTERKLRIQFKKAVQKGTVTNALLDPMASASVEQAIEPDEKLIVRVDLKQSGHYWFSDRRVLYENVHGIHELVRYVAVRHVHWMLKDKFKDPRFLAEGPKFKIKYYDRLEIETEHGLVVLEELDQAYVPTLSFFQWIIP